MRSARLAAFLAGALLAALVQLPGAPRADAAASVPGCQQFGGYPWVQGGCLNAQDINRAVNGYVGALPPQNSFGQGAQQGYNWLDTSAVPATWRTCVNPAGCATTFVTTDWARRGTINLSTRALVLGSGGYTVDALSALPSVAGDRTYVTDAVACTFGATPVHHGSLTCPVFYNGTAWVGG